MTADPAIILMAIRNIVDAQSSIANIAEKSNLGRESMYKMLSPKGNPTLSTFTSLLNGLGFHLKVEPNQTDYLSH